MNRLSPARRFGRGVSQPATSHWSVSPPGLKTVRSGELLCGDALEMMTKLRPDVADVIFLDPPFNLGKLYGKSSERADRLAEADYYKYMVDLLDACTTSLKVGGALFLYHIPRWAIRLGSILCERLTFRHWIAISMKNGFARGQRLYPAHYALLYFTKGDPGHFHRPKIAAPRCRHCGELVKDYGGYLEFVKAGINLSDIWDDLSPVRHKRNKTRPSNELPAQIPGRVVSISGVQGGLFIDPFAGSGSTIVAAVEAGMKFLACDREEEHCDIIKARARSARRQLKRSRNG